MKAEETKIHIDMPKECPNCKEIAGDCACMRNKCIKCNKPVGNITFTICDECWDKPEGEKKKGCKHSEHCELKAEFGCDMTICGEYEV